MPTSSHSVNENMSMSAAGYAALRFNEGVVMHYYDDNPKNGNCTWGIGTLAHLGSCTQEELRRTVLPEQVNAILEARVHESERMVRAIVNVHPLTQAQFDAAVSFAYNSSTRNIKDALIHANQGDMTAVARHMKLNIMITPRNDRGVVVGRRQISRGLMKRRDREAAPFEQGEK
jgi:GH24 family phage-related lysozyme (muramidase)